MSAQNSTGFWVVERAAAETAALRRLQSDLGNTPLGAGGRNSRKIGHLCRFRPAPKHGGGLPRQSVLAKLISCLTVHSHSNLSLAQSIVSSRVSRVLIAAPAGMKPAMKAKAQFRCACRQSDRPARHGEMLYAVQSYEETPLWKWHPKHFSIRVHQSQSLSPNL